MKMSRTSNESVRNRQKRPIATPSLRCRAPNWGRFYCTWVAWVPVSIGDGDTCTYEEPISSCSWTDGSSDDGCLSDFNPTPCGPDFSSNAYRQDDEGNTLVANATWCYPNVDYQECNKNGTGEWLTRECECICEPGFPGID